LGLAVEKSPRNEQHRDGRAAERTIRQIYRKLVRAWGPQHWWPAETPFEVILGAILTQNTSWTNVVRAIANLRSAGALSLENIRKLSLEELEQLIRPSGYFRQKARRVKDFVAFAEAKYGGSLQMMFGAPTDELRAELLTQKGIGEETADSILLYAGLKPVFVVDAYTRRILGRHEAVDPSSKYDSIRSLVEQSLAKEDAPAVSGEASGQLAARPAAHAPTAMSTAQQSRLTRVYNEMHGLLVQAGKHYCQKRRPRCEVCPLGEMLSPVQVARLQTVELPGRNTRTRTRSRK
jgi:endonuclease-3 related protein